MPIIDFLRGGTMIALLGVGLFFFRFWKQSRDRLFAFFSAAFFVMAVSQGAVLFFGETGEHSSYSYWLRLLAFVLIIVSVIEKNLPGKSEKS